MKLINLEDLVILGPGSEWLWTMISGRKLMYNSLGPATRIWWGLLAPSARAAREQANDQGVWVDFEWLAGIFAAFDRAANEPAAYDAAYIAQRLPDLIETNRTAVRRFEELRAVIVRSASDVIPEPGPARSTRPRRKRAVSAASS
ncbi:MAG TPA: hypothetical protein VNC22_05625 [Sporichthya sp.]|nr:hypothetical protein [Patescibacteria group bacterium]HVE24858.1 hypothetical protein [Sporichthya sp.]